MSAPLILPLLSCPLILLPLSCPPYPAPLILLPSLTSATVCQHGGPRRPRDHNRHGVFLAIGGGGAGGGAQGRARGPRGDGAVAQVWTCEHAGECGCASLLASVDTRPCGRVWEGETATESAEVGRSHR
eukprot:358237-Chlamydomonas_euryale.AAC.11